MSYQAKMTYPGGQDCHWLHGPNEFLTVVRCEGNKQSPIKQNTSK